MTILLVLLLTVLVAVGIRTFLQRAPTQGKPFLIKVGLLSVAVVVIILALGGRLHWMAGLLAGSLPFIRRLWPLLIGLLRLYPSWKTSQQTSRPSEGQQSEITTRLLHMTLDHDTGQVSGTIIAGPFHGRSLDQLSISELRSFYDQCRAEDPEGTRLLDAYIQRNRADQWPPDGDEPEFDTQTDLNMSVEEAWQVLDLVPGSPSSEIIKAHKRMISRLHPDKGGSNYLAGKINQAKERLLKSAKAKESNHI